MYFLNFLLSQRCIDCFKQTNTKSLSHSTYTNQNNYLQYSCFLSSCHTRNEFFFQFYSFWLILFKYPYCNRIVIINVITITSCFAMYSITITITCNHKNQRLQITFWLLKTCNWLHVITITDYNYNRSDKWIVKAKITSTTYSRTSLSRTRLFRITAYLEGKIWSLFLTCHYGNR